MAIKYLRVKKEFNLSSKGEEIYESNTRNETDPDQANNNEYPLQP